MEKINRLRGVKDVFSPESSLWKAFSDIAAGIFSRYGFSPIITPTIEELKLFSRGIGETTDIVIKEMYSFKDKKERDIVLRPEGTASVVRAFIENSMPPRSDLYYQGQMFRYERPQKGRDREFYQIGAESFGDASPYKDAEMILLARDIMAAAGIKSYVIKINSIGSKESQKQYSETLKKFLEPIKGPLCPDCRKKMERAPMRVLDCKVESCKKAVKGAPKASEHLDAPSKEAYEKVKALLKAEKVEFSEDSNLVRGLDYYTGTVFEFVTDKLGPQQNTLLAGGRYDGLVAELGGKETPAVGFALGIERCVEVMKADASVPAAAGIDAFIITDAKFMDRAFELLQVLRREGVSAAMSFEGKSFKSQMREADSRSARFSVIIGETEAANNTAALKDMKTGGQKQETAGNIAAAIKAGL